MFSRILVWLVKALTERYTHVKSRNKYYYLFTANKRSGRAGFPQMAIYMSVDGTIYARPRDEFDAKFHRDKDYDGFGGYGGYGLG